MRQDLRAAEIEVRGVPAAPLCFDSRAAWVHYVAVAASCKVVELDTRPFVGIKPRWNPLFAPCRDCTAQYETDMRRQGRCQKGAFAWTPAATTSEEAINA
jgi:hypothetical protein